MNMCIEIGRIRDALVLKGFQLPGCDMPGMHLSADKLKVTLTSHLK